ncbi:MAG: cell division protein FtsL [Alphaproteobacteria bacterium]|nr:cell division protein FtsL [Alphaproteobacteria bacterium]
MVRLLNFVCVAAMAVAILANYHISEQARVAAVELKALEHNTAAEREATTVLQVEWQRVAGPERVQALAQAKLGMADAATAQLASLELLPRHGDDNASGSGSEVQQVNAQSPAIPSAAPLELTPVSVRTGH